MAKNTKKTKTGTSNTRKNSSNVTIGLTRNQAQALCDTLRTLGHFSKTSKYSALNAVYSAADRALNG